MLDGSGCGWVQNIKSQDVFTLCGFTKSCFGMLFRAECDHWHNTQNMVSRTDTIINVPRPSCTCERGSGVLSNISCHMGWGRSRI